MKKKIAWVTDSTAYLTDELKQHEDVYIVPLTIIFNENEVYEDGINLTADELYTKLTQSETLPTTSQPAVGKFIELYEKLKEEYEHVIMLHIASGISGTLSTSNQAAEIVELNYHMIDTKALSTGITLLLEEGIKLEREGKTPNEIASRLTAIIDNFRNYFIVGKLEQMHKGGRLTKGQLLLGNLLSIKPIVHIDKESKAAVYDKIRTEKKAWANIYKMLIDSIENKGTTKVGLIHATRTAFMEEVKAQLLQKYPHLQIYIAPISAVLGVHGGEGTIGIAWFDHL
ncbi:MAG: DegV family protein [Bacillaceae bacterium]